MKPTVSNIMDAFGLPYASRDLPSAGGGNWRTSAFNVAYFHRQRRTANLKHRRMRVPTRRPAELAA